MTTLTLITAEIYPSGTISVVIRSAVALLGVKTQCFYKKFLVDGKKNIYIYTYGTRAHFMFVTVSYSS